jgi:hypothetical protein
MTLSEIPSLSEYLDKCVPDVEVVAGKVEGQEGHLFATFTLPSAEVAGMTGDELYLLYFKPLVDELAVKIQAMGRVCCRAIPLPGKGAKMVGFRCWKGRIPVNVYVMRRSEPDRHQYLIDLHVMKVEDDDAA